MKRRFFLSLGLALLLMIPGSPLAAAEFNYLSYDAALKKATAEDKVVMLFFWADWCGFCNQIRKEVFQLPEVHKVFDKNFVAVSIDTDKDPAGLAKKYKATALPNLTFVDGQGETIKFWPGFVDKDTFFVILKKVLATKNPEPNS